MPWETATGGPWSRLLETTRLACTKTDETFAKLGEGSLQAPFWFAFCAEFLAISSLLAVPLFAVPLVFPHFHLQMGPAHLAAGFLLLTTALSGFVIFVHVLWGLAMEWGVAWAGEACDYHASLRFGLYTCAWDLMTSPLGLLIAFWPNRHGLRSSWIRGALSAPKKASKAHLVERRALSPRARRSAEITALLVFGFGALLVLIATVLLSFYSLLHGFG